MYCLGVGRAFRGDGETDRALRLELDVLRQMTAYHTTVVCRRPVRPPLTAMCAPLLGSRRCGVLEPQSGVPCVSGSTQSIAGYFLDEKQIDFHARVSTDAGGGGRACFCERRDDVLFPDDPADRGLLRARERGTRHGAYAIRGRETVPCHRVPVRSTSLVSSASSQRKLRLETHIGTAALGLMPGDADPLVRPGP